MYLTDLARELDIEYSVLWRRCCAVYNNRGIHKDHIGRLMIDDDAAQKVRDDELKVRDHRDRMRELKKTDAWRGLMACSNGQRCDRCPYEDDERCIEHILEDTKKVLCGNGDGKR